MARVAMVTRTIVTTEVDVLCMNVETVAVETKTVTLLGAYSDETAMLKKVKEQIETDTLKPVHITAVRDIETLYGMTEAEFVNLAKALPPRKGTTETADEEIIETQEA
jgi:hypothetical protein